MIEDSISSAMIRNMIEAIHPRQQNRIVPRNGNTSDTILNPDKITQKVGNIFASNNKRAWSVSDNSMAISYNTSRNNFKK